MKRKKASPQPLSRRRGAFLSPPHSGGGREGAVLSAYQQNDFIAKFVGQFDAAKGEAAAPRGHFVGVHRVEDVGELFDFVVGIAVGGAILEAVEFLVVKIFDGFHGGLHRAKLFALRRFGRASGAVALAHDNGFFGAVGATIFAENKGENAQRQQRNQGYQCIVYHIFKGIYAPHPSGGGWEGAWNPMFFKSCQKVGYDFVTTSGFLMEIDGNFSANGANESAIRWSS